MGSYRVITDRESATGFRLAGVETLVADDVADAETQLMEAVNSPDAGIILINQTFMDHFPDAVSRKLEKLSLPLIIPIPVSMSWWQEAAGEDYIFRLIRRAIGYQMRIKRD